MVLASHRSMSTMNHWELTIDASARTGIFVHTRKAIIINTSRYRLEIRNLCFLVGIRAVKAITKDGTVYQAS